MEVHFTPDVQAKLDRLVTETGRSASEFVQDAMAGYVDELAYVADCVMNDKQPMYGCSGELGARARLRAYPGGRHRLQRHPHGQTGRQRAPGPSPQ